MVIKLYLVAHHGRKEALPFNADDEAGARAFGVEAFKCKPDEIEVIDITDNDVAKAMVVRSMLAQGAPLTGILLLKGLKDPDDPGHRH